MESQAAVARIQKCISKVQGCGRISHHLPFPGASANLKGGLKPAELQAPYAALHGLLTATYDKSYIYSGISRNLQYEWVR